MAGAAISISPWQRRAAGHSHRAPGSHQRVLLPLRPMAHPARQAAAGNLPLA